jgi:hypothetical protein
VPGKHQIIETGTDVTITLNADSGMISAGGHGANGQLALEDPGGHEVIGLNANNRHLALFGAPPQGPGPGPVAIMLDAASSAITLSVGGKPTIELVGQTGDIVLANADCAEEFDLAEPFDAQPGTVMVLNGAGRLRPSEEPYDRRVAGVLSGAGSLRPGIVLDRREATVGRLPLALLGKVYCKVDADSAPVKVGDLLTTSGTCGHAMKATDRARAFGSVLGKALQPLEAGTGLIPILVALQ